MHPALQKALKIFLKRPELGWWTLLVFFIIELMLVISGLLYRHIYADEIAPLPSMANAATEDTPVRSKEVIPPPARVGQSPEYTDVTPRPLEQILREEGDGDDANISSSDPSDSSTPPTQTEHQNTNATESTAGTTIETSEELARLLKEARYAQIEGDIKKSILKLEEASAIDSDHPVLLYYFGLAYEILHNTAKAREYYTKVYTLREDAGKYCALAGQRLKGGFASPADKRGDMCIGPIIEYKQPNEGDGEHVILTIPICLKDGLNVRPEDIRVDVQYYDITENNRITRTRANADSIGFITQPVDWADGEEIIESRYHLHQLTQDETVEYGDIHYFGYTVKLFYKGEPMDAYGSPPVLFLIEQQFMKHEYETPRNNFYNSIDGSSLLPELEATPMSEDNGTLTEDGLLPLNN